MEKHIEENMLMLLVNINEKVEKHDTDLAYLKESHDRTFRRIDDFLSTLGRHEAEIAALRSSRERMEDRLTKIEAVVGIV
ncbi:TPA: hypothetical protein DEB00_03630 [Candidatus Uhrbacteria bacterium]|nr:hypothetical protein [Candidatus Uhrbacteria bacterium]